MSKGFGVIISLVISLIAGAAGCAITFIFILLKQLSDYSLLTSSIGMPQSEYFHRNYFAGLIGFVVFGICFFVVLRLPRNDKTSQEAAAEEH